MTFDAIPRADWDRLLAATSAATPFSRWTFHRAWWDAYGTTAHDSYLVVCAPGSDLIRGIVPLMYRHEVEPEDLPTHTVVREHNADVRGGARRGESVHVRGELPRRTTQPFSRPTRISRQSVRPRHRRLCSHRTALTVISRGTSLTCVVSARSTRALPAFDSALQAIATTVGGAVIREQEDVCPVVTVNGDTWDEYLATLDKTARHEIRRKIRRAASGRQPVDRDFRANGQGDR